MESQLEMVLGHSRHGGKALYVEMLNSYLEFMPDVTASQSVYIKGPSGIGTGIITEHAQVSATSKDLPRRLCQ